MADVLFEGKGRLVSISGSSPDPGGKITEIEVVIRWTDDDYWVNFEAGRRLQRRLTAGCEQVFKLLVSDPESGGEKTDGEA